MFSIDQPNAFIFCGYWSFFINNRKLISFIYCLLNLFNNQLQESIFFKHTVLNITLIICFYLSRNYLSLDIVNHF